VGRVIVAAVCRVAVTGRVAAAAGTVAVIAPHRAVQPTTTAAARSDRRLVSESRGRTGFIQDGRRFTSVTYLPFVARVRGLRRVRALPAPPRRNSRPSSCQSAVSALPQAVPKARLVAQGPGVRQRRDSAR
jgi:hypothetical protein